MVRVDRRTGRRRPCTADGEDGRVAGVVPGRRGRAAGHHHRRDRRARLRLPDRAPRTTASSATPGTRRASALAAPVPVVTGIPRSEVHNGGRIDLGPDGMLYVATGDARDRGAPPDPGSLAGKVLRVTTDGDPAPGNPDPASPVWTSGHRNVQGLGWSADGTMWASEFGQDTTDELNVLRAGADHGWPRRRGGRRRRRPHRPGRHVVAPTTPRPAGSPSPTTRSTWPRCAGERLWRVPVGPGGDGDGRAAGRARRPGPAPARRGRPRRQPVGADEQHLPRRARARATTASCGCRWAERLPGPTGRPAAYGRGMASVVGVHSSGPAPSSPRPRSTRSCSSRASAWRATATPAPGCSTARGCAATPTSPTSARSTWSRPSCSTSWPRPGTTSAPGGSARTSPRAGVDLLGLATGTTLRLGDGALVTRDRAAQPVLADRPVLPRPARPAGRAGRATAPWCGGPASWASSCSAARCGRATRSRSRRRPGRRSRSPRSEAPGAAPLSRRRAPGRARAPGPRRPGRASPS